MLRRLFDDIDEDDDSLIDYDEFQEFIGEKLIATLLKKQQQNYDNLAKGKHITCIEFSENACYAATSCGSIHKFKFDILEPDCELQTLELHDGRTINALAVSPFHLLTAGNDKKLCVTSVKSFTKLSELELSEVPVAVSINQDETEIAYGTKNCSLEVASFSF